jgi:hypothetical protein
MTPREVATVPETESVTEPSGHSISESRESAVNAVIRGGATVVLGFGGTFASTYGLFGSASLLVGLGSVLIAGAGLVYAGWAARHLLRFGSRSSAVGFLSGGALGILVATWPILAALGGEQRLPIWFKQLFGRSVLGLSLIVLFFVLRVVVRWSISRWNEADPDPGSE